MGRSNTRKIKTFTDVTNGAQVERVSPFAITCKSRPSVAKTLAHANATSSPCNDPITIHELPSPQIGPVSSSSSPLDGPTAIPFPEIEPLGELEFDSDPSLTAPPLSSLPESKPHSFTLSFRRLSSSLFPSRDAPAPPTPTTPHAPRRRLSSQSMGVPSVFAQRKSSPSPDPPRQSRTRTRKSSGMHSGRARSTTPARSRQGADLRFLEMLHRGITSRLLGSELAAGSLNDDVDLECLDRAALSLQLQDAILAERITRILRARGRLAMTAPLSPPSQPIASDASETPSMEKTQSIRAPGMCAEALQFPPGTAPISIPAHVREPISSNDGESDERPFAHLVASLILSHRARSSVKQGSVASRSSKRALSV